jgi:hypothetical protein
MDDKFFAGALDSMKSIYGQLGELDVRNRDQATVLLTKLGAELSRSIESAGIEGADDLGAFTEVGKYLMAAQGGMDTIQNLRNGIMEQCDHDPLEMTTHLSNLKFALGVSLEDKQKTKALGGAELIFNALVRRLD